MMNEAPRDWHTANQQALLAELAEVKAAVARQGPPGAPPATQSDEASGRDDGDGPFALDHLCATFGLSRFERAVLTLCAGVELDADVAALCATAQGDSRRAYPTFSLALAALPDAHWSALTPAAPLRRWRLIEVGPGDGLTTSPLRIDERVLHYLAGTPHQDERLAGLVDLLPIPDSLVPSHQALAERVAATWARAASPGGLPVIQLCGDEVAGKRAIAAAACASLGLSLSALSAHAVPQSPSELEAFIRLWAREAVLSGSALLLECDDLDATDTTREAAIARLVERLSSPLMVAGRERRRTPHRLMPSFEVSRPTSGEQRVIWQAALGATAPSLNGQVDRLVSQFSLSAPTIYAACAEANGQLGEASAAAAAHIVWDACRAQARPRLDDLAQRIEPAATWDDLVLPDLQRHTLREIAAHVRQRARVYETWGFAARSSRGLGISALFAGASGTGKTMAAEVLAHELRLDLYRIDLSQVVSKYIGETEKNLRRVFDAAEEGGTILLFDEADALFGKRSEVKDSHDRYANIEVSYLLQRMEAYRGLAILTTNMKHALDQAFVRRIRFIVHFPFPDAGQRAEIWRRIYPAATPTEGLNVTRLARLNVAGGNIRNIALHAAFLAADTDEPVQMRHLLQAARSEYAKLEKPLTDAEVGGWA